MAGHPNRDHHDAVSVTAASRHPRAARPRQAAGALAASLLFVVPLSACGDDDDADAGTSGTPDGGLVAEADTETHTGTDLEARGEHDPLPETPGDGPPESASPTVAIEDGFVTVVVDGASHTGELGFCFFSDGSVEFQLTSTEIGAGLIINGAVGNVGADAAVTLLVDHGQTANWTSHSPEFDVFDPERRYASGHGEFTDDRAAGDGGTGATASGSFELLGTDACSTAGG